MPPRHEASFLGHRLPEHSSEPIAGNALSLAPLTSKLRPRREPKIAFRSNQFAEFLRAVKKVMEPARVERSASFTAKTGNAVPLCFRQMLAAHFLQPTGCLFSTLKIEQPRIQNLIDIDFAIRDRTYLRV